MDSPFETKIAEALEELNGPSKPSLRAVKKKYGVSRRTLQRRHSGGVSKQFYHETSALRKKLLCFASSDVCVQYLLSKLSTSHVTNISSRRLSQLQLEVGQGKI
jgi:hypothetical protein